MYFEEGATGFSEPKTNFSAQSSKAENLKPKPFLKWVGGKRSILPVLISKMPETYNGYYESFVGGGALFFEQQPKKAYISDTNARLIETYKALRDELEDVISLLAQLSKKHDEIQYKAIRQKMNDGASGAELAAYMIYLNKTCFNGLYRVNKSGKFNVPIGDYKNPTILDEKNLRAVSTALKNTQIENHEFQKTPIRKGAFYYFDPPYHKTFTSYSDQGFGEKAQTELSEFCKKLNDHGAYFMLSNSGTDFIRNLYQDFSIENVLASRSVSCKGNQRGKESEFIIRNYE